jgi:hypothetical protein
MRDERGTYEVIHAALAAGMPSGAGVTEPMRLRFAEVAVIEAKAVHRALRDAYGASFTGGAEHHCIDEQGCRACAVSEFLGPSDIAPEDAS